MSANPPEAAFGQPPIASQPELPDTREPADETPDPDRGPVEEFDLQSFYDSQTELNASGAEPEQQDGQENDESVPDSEDTPSRSDTGPPTPELTIIGFVPRDLFREAGSVTVIDQASLEALEHNDPHQVLLQVPGLTVRGEDGYGLRPNIGIRGTSSDRSSKITLMEDGVLFGPAPYAAPAAYYFPLINRMVGVEVTKGPAAILYGPQTIGGAINLRTREVPEELLLGFDASLGTNLLARAHGFVGAANDWGGFLAEVIHTQTNGFKVIDPAIGADGTGSDTGFSRTDVMLKGQLFSERSGETFHRVQLKLGFSQEGSNETYLGLSDADFRVNPVRRYRASALDRMEWWRTQVELRYQLEVGDDFSLSATAYRHDFQRSWFRLNRFGDTSVSLRDVLQNPTGGRRAVLFDILTGQSDSTPASSADNLFIVDNDRRFVSMGLQTTGVLDVTTGPVEHRIEVGLRLHADEVERNHIETEFLMQGGDLIAAGTSNPVAADNTGNALAFSGYAAYSASWENLTLMPGVRFELISTSLDDDLAGTESDNTRAVLLPGMGVHYAFSDSFAALVGVHRGFSPVAPGQPAEVAPEFAVNWEAGIRYLDKETNTQLEVIGFWNDYSNILGACSFSSGCDATDLDRQFNGGEATVLGVEVVAAHTLAFDGMRFPMRASYTLTHGTFDTSFDSANPLFGEVETGDALPYVPVHQASVQVGVVHDRIQTHLQATYVGAMRESAGQGDDPLEPKTDDYLLVNWMTAFTLVDALEVYLRVENLFNAQPITARRPFGARPLRPFTAQFGVRWNVGS